MDADSIAHLIPNIPSTEAAAPPDNRVWCLLHRNDRNLLRQRMEFQVSSFHVNKTSQR